MRVRLYDHALVRRLKRAAKEQARRQGRKSARGKWWKPSGGTSAKWWLWWLLINAVRMMGQKPLGALQWKSYLLAGASLVLAGVSLSQARKLKTKLTTDTERTVLLFYPISDKDFFIWATLRFVAKTIWIWFLALVVYFLTTEPTGAGWIIRVAAPVAEWLVVLCAVFALARHTNKYPRWLSLALYVAAGILLIAPEKNLGIVQPLASALPTGWLHLFMTSPRAQDWAPQAICCSLPLLGVLSWSLSRQLQRDYSGASEPEIPVPELIGTGGDKRREEPYPGDDDVDDAELADSLETTGEAALPIQAVWRKQRLANWGSEVAEYLWQGQWLRMWNWHEMPPIERVAGWCLNQREKTIAQFLLGPKPPVWSERWKIAVIATAAAFAVILLAPERLHFVAILAAAVAIAVGLPILGGNWPATNQGRISGKHAPIFSCFPLSYWKAGSTMFKLNAVRTLAWTPIGILMAILETRSTGLPLSQTAWVAAKGILLVLMVTPILLAGKFSKVTNDTLHLRLMIVPLIGAFLVVTFLVITLASMTFILESSLGALACILTAGLTSWSTWAVYGWYYNRCQVDLLREKP